METFDRLQNSDSVSSGVSSAPAMRPGEWKTPEALALLRRRRREGVTYTRIADELGCSKGAAISAAHALELPVTHRCDHRRWTDADLAVLHEHPDDDASTLMQLLPSHSRRAIMMKRSRLRHPTAPPAIVKADHVRAAPARPPRQPKPSATSARPPPQPPPAPVAAPRTPAPYGRITECCWPIGEPGSRRFRFCDEPSEPGKPYCSDHAKLAYVANPRGHAAPLGQGRSLLDGHR